MSANKCASVAGFALVTLVKSNVAGRCVNTPRPLTRSSEPAERG